MQPGSRKVIKPRDDSHTILLPSQSRVLLCSFWALWGALTGLSTWALTGQEDLISPDKLRCVNSRGEQCASARMEMVSLASSLQDRDLLITHPDSLLPAEV